MMSTRKGFWLLAMAGLVGLPAASYANQHENRMEDSRSSSEGRYNKAEWKFDRADYYKDSDSPSFKYVDERSRSDSSRYDRSDMGNFRAEERERPTLNPNVRSFNERGSMRGDEDEEYGAASRFDGDEDRDYGTMERSNRDREYGTTERGVRDRDYGSMERGMSDRDSVSRDHDVERSGRFGARGSAGGSGNVQGSGNLSGSGNFSGSGNMSGSGSVGGSGSFSGSGSAGASGGGAAGGK